MSASFSWLGEDGVMKSVYRVGETAIEGYLMVLEEHSVPLLVYNAPFELGVTLARFPDRKLNFQYDCMRLVQVYDHGDTENYEKSFQERLDQLEDLEGVSTKKRGLGLDVSLKRILPHMYEGKEVAHQWIKENCPGVKKSEYGRYLTKLPPELLQRYNINDTENTLRLYLHITDYFKEIEYDWSKDHTIYMNSSRLIAESQLRGIKVDRSGLANYIREIDTEVTEIESHFKHEFATQLQVYEDQLLNKKLAGYKSERGRQKYLDTGELPRLNFNSGTQLGEFFEDIMGLSVQFKTATGKASTKAAHLGSYGNAGKLLVNRKKRLLVRKQTEKLYELSEYDGRWHISLKSCGTTSGRFAGGGGLNVQGLARRDRGLMSCLLPDDGHIFISSDGAKAEPTVSAHLTGDKNYRRCVFDMIGKPPVFENGILWLDDIYLTVLSISYLSDSIMFLWYNGVRGRPFAEQWLEDPEIIKDILKRERKFMKIVCLGLGYEMGPRNLVKQSYDQGYQITLKQARSLYKAYWGLFNGMRIFANKAKMKLERDQQIINPFGYRMSPKVSYKANNYLTQSSVSGMFHIILMLFEEYAPYAQMITVIHDEVLYQIPRSKVEEFRVVKEKVVNTLNDMLNWDIDVGLGFVTGNNMYEAK